MPGVVQRTAKRLGLRNNLIGNECVPCQARSASVIFFFASGPPSLLSLAQLPVPANLTVQCIITPSLTELDVLLDRIG